MSAPSPSVRPSRSFGLPHDHLWAHTERSMSPQHLVLAKPWAQPWALCGVRIRAESMSGYIDARPLRAVCRACRAQHGVLTRTQPRPDHEAAP